jgi:hypothetical protein
MLTPVVNTEHTDEIKWFEAEKDPPSPDSQARTVEIRTSFTVFL